MGYVSYGAPILQQSVILGLNSIRWLFPPVLRGVLSTTSVFSACTVTGDFIYPSIRLLALQN